MSDFDQGFIDTLAVQSWTLYGIGIVVIAMRLYARAYRLGVKNYQPDDWLTLAVVVLYTALIVLLNTIAQGGGSNLFPPELEGTFTPHEIEERIMGSKIVVVSEQCMLNVIYVIKAQMLVMYTRLTLGLHIQKMVRYLAIYVLCGWVATEIAFFTACRPFQGYWGMPPPNPQCTTLQRYAIVQGCFNISSDALMLFIPLPLVLRMSVPWRQKIVLVFIFSLGVFVIVAALLTKIFNLTNIYDPSYMYWYVREACVAVCVTNLPMIWPLLREWFPSLRHLTPGAKTSQGTPGRKAGHMIQIPSRGASPSRTRTTRTATRKGFDDDDFVGDSGDSTFDLEMTMPVRVRENKFDTESMDRMMPSSDSPNAYSNASDMEPGQKQLDGVSFLDTGGIQVERTIIVHEEMRSPRPQDSRQDSAKLKTSIGSVRRF